MSELKGLFEMMYGVVGTWIDEFLADMEANFLFSTATPHGNRAAASSQKAWQSPPFSQPSPDVEMSTGVGFASPTGMPQKRGPACTEVPWFTQGLNCCSPPPPQGTVARLQRTPPGSRRVSEHGLGTPGLPSHDASSSGAADVVATTQRIRHINQEAQTDDRVSRRVSHWRDVFRGRGRELRGAVAAWQAKRGGDGGLDDVEEAPGECTDSLAVGVSKVVALSCTRPMNLEHKIHGHSSNPLPPRPPIPDTRSPSATTHPPSSVKEKHPALLTTGFLDGARPVVDVYELRVRLQHMLPRLRVLQVAAASARPLCLLPGVYLSDAVGASSTHTLRHLGITHILNATEDLLGPDPSLGATWVRCSLRDIEEEDISPFFEVATRFIDGALSTGGRVLVHCHAGRSRSCSLVRC